MNHIITKLMKLLKLTKLTKLFPGFSLVEIILATTLFAMILVGLGGVLLYGIDGTATAGKRSRAVLLAEEGLEGVRNIRDDDFANLSNGASGLKIVSNNWALQDVSDTNDIFTRQIQVSEIDPNRKLLTSTVNWDQNLQRTGSVSLFTYFTNWSAFMPDIYPPSAILNLSSANPTTTTIDLIWTSPGDDRDEGTATVYDIRYATATINNENKWSSASQVSGEPLPAIAGSSQSMTVTGLTPNTRYHFAIRTADEIPNVSELSNSPNVSTSK